MNKHSSIQASGSLLERAAQKYDFAAALRGAAQAEATPAPQQREVLTPTQPAVRPSDMFREAFNDTPPASGRHGTVNRARLAEGGFILPDERPGALAEEFRIVKRQLLLRAAGEGGQPIQNGRMILVGSAKPDEGKTFCSVNLALSMAREKDLDVVLVDCDFSKPEIPGLFGLEDGPGMMDALADPSVDAESCIIHTDIPNLSVLPAGRQSHDATELIASQRTRDVLDRLISRSPTRIMIFDSPPALSASAASALAAHAGQAVMVVKADTTDEAELREALGLLDGCRHIQLLLNGVTFTPNGKRFASYYGYGD